MKALAAQMIVAHAQCAWVIRAGVRGSADGLFLKNCKIALSDPGLGSLSNLDSRRAAFYEAYGQLRPGDSLTSIAGVGGKFFRFVHEMKNGDIVLYPSCLEKVIHVGVISGHYRYTSQDRDYPHQRDVRWIACVEKSSLSQPALYELGAARTLFKYKHHLAEVTGKARPTTRKGRDRGQRRSQ